MVSEPLKMGISNSFRFYKGIPSLI